MITDCISLLLVTNTTVTTTPRQKRYRLEIVIADTATTGLLLRMDDTVGFSKAAAAEDPPARIFLVAGRRRGATQTKRIGAGRHGSVVFHVFACLENATND